MFLHELLILIAVSFGAGTLGALLGLGGGFIIVPALTFMSFNPSQIASTSLFAVFSTSASSTLAYARQKRIDYSLGIRFALIAIPGAIIGAYISDFITMQSFKLYFALVLIGTSVYIFRKSELAKEHKGTRSSAVMALCYVASFFAGILAGLFGIGGGVIFVPLMVVLLGMSMHVSAPTSQFIFLISSVAGLASHVVLGHPDYLVALVLVAGAFAGAQLGAKISLHVKEKLLQKLLSISLLAVAAKFIVDVFTE
ncbi:MAG TPA: sulfite exporter TauE/SafE family protein [Nitrososphaerales archaeon]|nr:sulfite exporter TauE/SafE family protein [Nitrososphaerales archaeon]